jgi:hypothetical protein
MSTPSPGSRRVGCGFGCLVAVIIAVVLFTALALYVVASIRRSVGYYSSEGESPIPQVSYDVSVVADATRKWEQLREAIGEQSRTTRIEFTGPELNALISRVGWGRLLAIQLVRDSARAQFSFKLADFGGRAMEMVLSKALLMRFFNGTCVFKVGLTENRPRVVLESLDLDGKAFESDGLRYAEQYISGMILTQLVAAGAQGDSSKVDEREAEELLSRVSRFTTAAIKDGVLVLEIGEARRG